MTYQGILSEYIYIPFLIQEGQGSTEGKLVPPRVKEWSCFSFAHAMWAFQSTGHEESRAEFTYVTIYTAGLLERFNVQRNEVAGLFENRKGTLNTT